MGDDQTTQIRRWIARLGGGDDAALNELLTHFQGRLVLLARKMLRGYPDVRAMEQTGDVLQNAAVRLERALRDLARRGAGPADAANAGAGGGLREADFFRLAAVQIRRELLDLAKHYRSRVAPIPPGGPRPGESAAGGDLPDHPTWDPRRLVEWAEFHEQAAALPEKSREVFDLLWYQGLSQGEAAEAIGVDVRTVKVRWQDARLRLCEVFEGRMPGA